MIDRDYCIAMAHYNAWQNTQLTDSLDGVGDAVLRQDRGAFFRSILGTLNHVLWGDTLWMSRFDGGAKPQGGIPESHALHPTFASWSADRFRLDRRITHWAERLNTIDLKGDLTWFSGALGRDMTKKKELCVLHMFNHQTHHRGQIHAMMTAAGLSAPVSDLAFMPEP